MLARNGFLAALAVLVLVLHVSPALAEDGIVVSSIPAFDPRDPAAQPTASELKLLAAKQMRHEELEAAHKAWLQSACPTGVCPNSVPGDGGGSYPYSVTLFIPALQQQYCNWCGPATTQAIQLWNNDMAWSNSQSTIATYEETCFPPSTCGTYVYKNRQGLNNYVQPQPANFIYWEYQPTSDGDWWAKLQTGIGGYGMPQVATVAPHDINAAASLPSWPTEVNAGHYIVIDGYTGYTFAGGSVHYTDSSSGCAGGTGSYSTSSETMRYVIVKANDNHPSNWVIW